MPSNAVLSGLVEAPDPEELKRRAGAIVGWSRSGRKDLAKALGVRPGTFNAWLTSSKPKSYPSVEQLINLAAAVEPAVPRRFAERGFDDLRELPQRVNQLEDQLAGLAQAVASVAATLPQTDEEQPPNEDPPEEPQR